MSEREEALRRFPPAEAQKLVPQTTPHPYKEYTPKPAWQMTKEEYYEPVTLPDGWKNKGYKPIIEKVRGKRGYIARVITPDGETLYPADPSGIGWVRSKYQDDHRMKVEAAVKQGLPVPAEVLADYSQHPKYDLRTQKQLEDLRAMREASKIGQAAPQTKHLYTTMVRQFIDELEKLIRTDQKEFYRKKKMVRDAIKERERGKINWLPGHSLTDLRQIKKEMDLLYG